MFASSMLRRLAGAACAGLTACSLTYQSVYEGDVRFEHCYRLDDEREVLIGEKLRCWHEWSQKHTYGQTRDRIEYAIARERALGQAQAAGERTAPRGLVFPNGAIWSPQPTSAFVSPPQTMSRDAGAAEIDRGPGAASLVESSRRVGTEPASAPLTTPPGATCGGTCGKVWVRCSEVCKGSSCQPGCDETYRVCMHGCF
jgi:hypothetical protein